MKYDFAVRLLKVNKILNKLGISLVLVLEGSHCLYSHDEIHFELCRTRKFFEVTGRTGVCDLGDSAESSRPV